MKLSKLRWLLSGTLAMGLVGTSVALLLRAEDKDENKNEVKVTLDQVPAAVKDTLVKESKDGKIDEIEKETKGDKTIYEADITIGDKHSEVKVADDGTVIKRKDKSKKDDDDDKK